MGFSVKLVETPKERQKRVEEAKKLLQEEGILIAPEGLANELLNEEAYPAYSNALNEARLLLGVLEQTLVQGDELAKSSAKLAHRIDEILKAIKL